MSHKRKCGCIISDSHDSHVRLGYALSGEVLSRCANCRESANRDTASFVDYLDELIARAIALHEEREH